MPKLDYPKILTNKDWQSKKALADKVGKNKKTGLGDELDRFQAAYAKSAYAKPSEGLKLVKPVFDPIRFTAELGNVRTQFAAERKKLEPVVISLNKKIDDTAKALGPTSTTGKHLAKMKQALRDFNLTEMAEHVRLVERDCVKAYAAHLRDKSTAFGFVIDKGNPGRKNVAPYAEYLDKIKTYNDIDHFFNPGELSVNPPGRALSTLCQNWDRVMIADFPDYAKKFYAKSAMNEIFDGLKWIKPLATPHPSGTMTAVADLKAKQGDGQTEQQLVAGFVNEAKQSLAKAQKFLDAYFSLIDTMPKDLQKL